ncbi:unnamed protein product [Cunninghamella echinulata]
MIKKVLLILLLTNAIIAGIIPSCPKQEIETTKCMGPKYCLYLNPNNCNSFIHCIMDTDEINWKPVVLPCPSDFEWNDNEKICDWPSSSTCRD